MSHSLNRRSALTLATAGAALAAIPARAVAGRNTLVDNYVDAWSRKDVDAILACMGDDVEFRSPNAVTHGADAYRTATVRFLPLVEKVELRARLSDDDRAMLVYDFVCRQPIGVSPVAELITFKHGRIASSEIFFDTAPFAAFARAQHAAAAGQSK